jgi:CBS domain-containing protein
MKTDTRQPRIDALLVNDVMHRGIFTCERQARLSEVAATMAREHVHCVVVESGSAEAGPPWGIVSDLDLVAASIVRDLAHQSAGGSAATPVVTVSPNETLGRAAQLMTEHNTAHLIVVDRERPIGVLSTIDIATCLAARSPGVRWRARELR